MSQEATCDQRCVKDARMWQKLCHILVSVTHLWSQVASCDTGHYTFDNFILWNNEGVFSQYIALLAKYSSNSLVQPQNYFKIHESLAHSSALSLADCCCWLAEWPVCGTREGLKHKRKSELRARWPQRPSALHVSPDPWCFYQFDFLVSWFVDFKICMLVFLSAWFPCFLNCRF